MNLETARSRGYVAYVPTWGDIHECLAKVRKQGYKAVIVTEPPDKYARGYSGKTYTIYAEELYSIDRKIENANKQLDRIPGEREYLRKKYEEELRIINQRELDFREMLQRYTEAKEEYQK